MQNLIEVDSLVKTFNGNKVVDRISFAVEKGATFAMLGPNGAGKTTTTRILLNILRPDSGSIRLFGKEFNEASKANIGYLPEERGLYKNLSVIDSLVYLAMLKGIAKQEARKRIGQLLKEMQLYEHRNKRVNELSKGMQQKLQFIAAIAHDPQLVILDEPFSGLDPLNIKLVKREIQKLRKQGKTVILSTHMMNEAEDLCDRVLMINHGRRVLYGDVADIRERYSQNSIKLEYKGKLTRPPGIGKVKKHGNKAELFLQLNVQPKKILMALLRQGLEIKSFGISRPSLREIFVLVVEAEEWIEY